MTRPCSICGSSLEKPGDYCLVCRTSNADGAIVSVHGDEATLIVLDSDRIVGEPTVSTVSESGDQTGSQRRNFLGRIADEIRRKRPDADYLAGDREVHADRHFDWYRVDGEDPVAAARTRRNDRALEVIETPPAKKVSGSHSTLIGGRRGRAAVLTVAGHPYVKKVIPGRIDAGGSGSRSDVRAKVMRADPNGNVRLLVRAWTTVQDNRVMTTAMDRDGSDGSAPTSTSG